MTRHLLLAVILCAGFFPVLAQESEKPPGKFSGYMFGDVFFNAARDDNFSSLKNTAIPGDKEARGFQFRRIYLTYDNDISSRFSARLRFEADQVELTSKKDKSSKTAIFVKDASLKWKNIFEGSDLILGIQPPPSFEISEAAWGYRSLEKTIMDLRGIASSRDFGLALKGRFDTEANYNYWVMIANNSGVNAETDKYNRFYSHIHVKPFANFQATLYADYNQKPKILSADSSKTIDNNATTFGVFAGYSEKDRYSFGVETVMSSTQNGLNRSKTNNAVGLTVFGTYALTSSWGLVARFDYFDPSNDKDVKGDARNYLLGGVTWKVDKNVSFTPNVQVETFQKPPGGKAPDASVTYRITFFYAFL